MRNFTIIHSVVVLCYDVNWSWLSNDYGIPCCLQWKLSWKLLIQESSVEIQLKLENLRSQNMSEVSVGSLTLKRKNTSYLSLQGSHPTAKQCPSRTGLSRKRPISASSLIENWKLKDFMGSACINVSLSFHDIIISCRFNIIIFGGFW